MKKLPGATAPDNKRKNKNLVRAPAATFALPALLLGAENFASAIPAIDVILISIDTYAATSWALWRLAIPSRRSHVRPGSNVFCPRLCAVALDHPSHAGLLTGLANHRRREHHGFTDAGRGLDAAERFTQAGYHTAAFVNILHAQPALWFRPGIREYTMDPEADGDKLRERFQWLQHRAANRFFCFCICLIRTGRTGRSTAHAGDGGQLPRFCQSGVAADNRTARLARDIERRSAAIVRWDSLLQALRSHGRYEKAWWYNHDHGEEWWDHDFSRPCGNAL